MSDEIKYEPLDPAQEAGIHAALKERGETGIILGKTPDGNVHVRLTTEKPAPNLELNLSDVDFEAFMPKFEPARPKILSAKMPEPPPRPRRPFTPPPQRFQRRRR